MKNIRRKLCCTDIEPAAKIGSLSKIECLRNSFTEEIYIESILCYQTQSVATCDVIHFINYHRPKKNRVNKDELIVTRACVS